MLRYIVKSIPYLWIGINLYAFIKSYHLNGYSLVGDEQMKMLEHVDIVYPFFSTNIIHYDLSELVFSCIVPVYIFILVSRLVASFLAK